MPYYTYTAIKTENGREESGNVESSNRMDAVVLLRSRGLSPTRVEATVTPAATPPSAQSKPKVTRGKVRRHWVWGRVVGQKGLTVFMRQLATLTMAGMPLTRSLEVLARQERNIAFQEVLRDLSAVIGAGGTLSDGLRRHPRIFDPLCVNMVKAGEAGSALGVVLERLAHFMEKHERLKGRVKSAMIYPVIIMTVAAGILAILMVFVVPRFEQIFTGLLRGQPLPLLTRALLAGSNFAKGHSLLLIGALALLFLGGRGLRRTSAGGRGVDWLLIRAPVIGDLTVKAVVARFSRTLGALLASGVSILEALRIARNTAGNVHIAAALDHVHARITQGDSIASPLSATAIFPDMVAGMIEVGEETGALPEMLVRIADTYDEEVDAAVAGLTSIVEPIMIVLMAGVVGVIVIALFLPIMSVIQHLQ